MLWVKGELLTDIDAPAVDPTGQLGRETQPNLFDRHDWFRRIWRHDGSPILIGRAASEGALCWLMLKLEIAGSLAALANRHSLAFRPIFAGAPDDRRRHAMLAAIARRVRKARPRIASVALSPAPEADGTAALLEKAFRAAGWITFSSVAAESVTASPEPESAAGRSPAEDDCQVRIVSRFDDEAWQTLERIRAEAVMGEEKLPLFLRDLAEAESEAGIVRLGLCHVNGVAVAAQLWTVENGVALVHARAKREVAGEVSPDSILSAAMAHHAKETDGIRTIEFGTGSSANIVGWMESLSPLIRIEAFNPATFRGLAGALRTSLSRLVRSKAGPRA